MISIDFTCIDTFSLDFQCAQNHILWIFKIVYFQLWYFHLILFYTFLILHELPHFFINYFLLPYRNLSFSSVTQSCLTLRPQGLQHARLPCPSSTPRACSNSCPSTWWCHPTISSSVIPFTSWLQSFPVSGLFQGVSTHITWPKYWNFIFNISPSNEYSGLISCTMNWLDLLAVQGTLKNLLQRHSLKHQFFGAQLSL